MVPAASRRSVLKSRPLRGKSLTAWLESFSPPELDFSVAAMAMGARLIARVFCCEIVRTVSAAGS
jgi:hypothetical protein